MRVRSDSFGTTGLYVEAKNKEPVIMLIADVCPNAVSKYQAFVDDVNDALQRVRSTEVIILLRDFNSHIGTGIGICKDVTERYTQRLMRKAFIC